ncbi:unnamed protein product [Clonostachys rosea]|uniref:Haloacid dehalogenase-like hydrolase n=1 Tax=Bionectria ochroleuca TaxID=29856 RepID=A0ABY6TXH6_BIOOC|nr:unnamed protein product [Clonostachys rosea]
MLGYKVLSFSLWAVSANAACKHRSTAPEVFVDFDGTIAANETILMFADAVYTATPPDKITLPPLNPKTFNNLKKRNFLAEYQENITLAQEEYGNITTFEEEVDFAASDLRRSVDAVLYDRVASSGMIEYLTVDILEKYASAVTIRDGWWDFALAAARRGSVPTILTNNFSIQWVRLVLRTSYQDYQSGYSNITNSTLDIDEAIPIYCSEIIGTQLLPSSPTDHEFSSHSGGDKVDILHRLMIGQTKPSLYVGNSLNDLPPLVDAGAGILVGITDDVQTQLKAEGGDLRPFKQSSLPFSEGDGEVLYTAADWNPLIPIFEK